MSSSVDIFKLNNDNIIIHVLQGNYEETTTAEIEWDAIRSIQITQGMVIIYHSGTIYRHNIDPNQNEDVPK
ncbi:MAG: hypothetical protein V3W20_01265 [Candidatus Neomarinimicrobiota bacterium]